MPTWLQNKQIVVTRTVIGWGQANIGSVLAAFQDAIGEAPFGPSCDGPSNSESVARQNYWEQLKTMR